MKKTGIVKIILLSVIVISLVLIIIGANGIYQNRQLFKAIEKNNIEDAEKAINRGAWINTRRHLLYIPELAYINPTPLISACKIGNVDMVKLLLKEGADINKKDNFTDETPLLAALHGTKGNRFSLAQYVIEHGADIYAVQEADSPLKGSLLVLETDGEETIKEAFELFKYLFQYEEIRSSLTSYSGESVLTFAAHYRNYNVVKYLIENEYFDVDSRDFAGNTALIVAAKNEYTSIVKLLLELGADPSLTDNEGKTALEYAFACQNSEMISVLERAS